jgi:hypothetical protein
MNNHKKYIHSFTPKQIEANAFFAPKKRKKKIAIVIEAILFAIVLFGSLYVSIFFINIF